MGNVVTMRGFDGAATIPLKISTSVRNRGEVENVRWTWADLVARLNRPTRDKLTLAQFKKLPGATQLKRKNNGYFVGAQFRHGLRKKALMGKRALITFDIDQGTPGLLADLELGTSGLGDMEYAAYSTRNHSAAAPRIRLVIPLNKPLDHDKFEPLSRILASKLDETMMMVDAVSFRHAQFMYWPSVCAGEDFFFRHNTGAVLDADAVLKEFGDWQDYGQLPRSERERDLRASEDKAPDPRNKSNIVGAFCRVYSVHDAISKYLDDLYTPSETGEDGNPSRYSFTKGSTVNGAIVYDDGQYLYSHHGTDPCGGKLVNAFDLVRVHLYGDKDDRNAEDVPVHKLPSFELMRALLADDAKVAAEMLQVNYGDTDDAWDDMPDDGEDGAPDTLDPPGEALDTLGEASESEDDWRKELDVTSEGIVKAGLPNTVLILDNHPPFKGRFTFNEFTQEHMVAKPIKSKSLRLDVRAGPVADIHLSAVRLILESKRGKGKPGFSLKTSQQDLIEAHRLVSERNRFNPVHDYLRGLAWDGIKRMDQLWVRACHTPDNAYFRQTACMWLVGAVARAFEPGCKFDFAPIIEGPQGLFKSTLLMILGSVSWTGEMTGHFDDVARFVESTSGCWIVEIPELVQFGKAEVESIKACISRKVDTVRLAYARFKGNYPRRSVMAGTTNRRTYLKDSTGNRRFWPIPCGPGQIDTAWAIEWRDQLWAEAVATYRDMRAQQSAGDLPLYLSDREAAAYAVALQGNRLVEDSTGAWSGQVKLWLDTPVSATQAKCGAEPGDDGDMLTDDAGVLVQRTVTCAKEVWERVVGKDRPYGNSQAQEVARIMEALPEWTAPYDGGRACGRYGKQRVYVRMTGRPPK